MLVPPSTYIRSRPTAHTQLWVRSADALLMLWHPPVFRALPDNWTANEVDVVRVTLLLAYVAHSVSIVHGLDGFAHGAAEVVVFACMRPQRFATTGSPPSMTPSNFAKTILEARARRMKPERRVWHLVFRPAAVQQMSGHHAEH